MKHTLVEESLMNENDIRIKILSNPTYELLGLSFKKDLNFDKHSTPRKAILIAPSVYINIFNNGEKHNLQIGSFFQIPDNVEHEVKAKTDSCLYLIK